MQGTDKDGKKFGGSEFTTVGGEYDLHIGDSRYEGIEKAYNLTVKTDTLFDLQTAHHTIVGTEFDAQREEHHHRGADQDHLKGRQQL